MERRRCWVSNFPIQGTGRHGHLVLDVSASYWFDGHDLWRRAQTNKDLARVSSVLSLHSASHLVWFSSDLVLNGNAVAYVLASARRGALAIRFGLRKRPRS